MVVMWAGRADNQGLCWSRPRRKRQQPHREGASGGRMHSVFTVQASKPLIRELHSRPPPQLELVTVAAITGRPGTTEGWALLALEQA